MPSRPPSHLQVPTLPPSRLPTAAGASLSPPGPEVFAADDSWEARRLQRMPLAQKRQQSKWAQFRQEFSVLLSKPDYLVAWLVPFFANALLCILFAYGFMELPSLCILAALSLSALATFLLAIRHRGHVWGPLGLGLALATLTGAAAGFYVYDSYACFPAFYANSRVYTNVVPSQPSAAVADAGKITFASEAVLDTNHSVAYVSERGQSYCVAPVRDASGSPRIEFWAVGMGCCDTPGSFTCDQASDASASAGIRIFDNSGYFADSAKDFFVKARKKAEASFALVSSERPMYVRWVREDNMDMLAMEYQTKAILALTTFLLLYLVAAALVALATYRPRK